MTDLRARTAEMLAFESNPSRDQWRKLVTELLALESVLSELWTLRMLLMSCSVMTAQQSSEYAARSDKAWQEVEKLMGERG